MNRTKFAAIVVSAPEWEGQKIHSFWLLGNLRRPRKQTRRRASGAGSAVPSPKMASPLSLQLECGGGAELLFGGIRKQRVTLPPQQGPWDVRKLLVWMKENLLKERPELFVQGESVRPGILVLINGADWELMGELDYLLQDQDNVVFISTLHGG